MEKMSEENDRNEILYLVKSYYEKHLKDEKPCKCRRKIPYAGRVYDEKELVNLVDSALDFWLTAGKYAETFETNLKNYLNVQYCSSVNSGSSANLIAFAALTSPLLGERAIKRGDEVITVAAGFPTTIAPIVQNGCIPVFADVTIPQYNIDCKLLEKALSAKTKAVMIAHTMGNPFDLNRVREFCRSHNLWLIEDNCDALGSRYYIDGQWKYTGTIGDIGTSSFYPPHHITTGEGGAVYTNNRLLHKIINSMRDWGRDCVCPPGKDNICESRFDRQYGKLPIGYDHKYVYSHFGYNLKITEMQAAVGCAQLEKLPLFIEKRKENFTKIYERLEMLKDKLILPQKEAGADPSWFGFAITCRKGVKRDKLIENLEKNHVQTRMLFAGNILKHPCFEHYEEGKDYRTAGDLINTEVILKDTFWIGVYPGLNDTMIDFMTDKIKESLR